MFFSIFFLIFLFFFPISLFIFSLLFFLPPFTAVGAPIGHHQNTPLHHLSSNRRLVFQEFDPNLMKQRPNLRSLSFSDLPFILSDHHGSPVCGTSCRGSPYHRGIVEQRSRVPNPNSNREVWDVEWR
ncbi:hypothetical protein ES332_A12G002600v1 [Gossypium tomentosum]|uniref:Uncharacterized protein n=1 Tax=Gossypium tomentosum TaxID=34277 RepID=A0A5D2MQR7_GOSTO|nr:hypothetical protein ES332_A12G002600v1 [Gossypium tomentosum]